MFYLGFGPDVSDKNFKWLSKDSAYKVDASSVCFIFFYSIFVDLQDQILLTSF